MEKSSSSSKKKYLKVDKYIYEIEKGKKYRVFIRSGSFYFSTVFYGTLAQAKKLRDRKLAEFKLDNGKNKSSKVSFYDFVEIYYKEYGLIELSPTTISREKYKIENYIFPNLCYEDLGSIDTFQIQRIINKLRMKDKIRKDSNGNKVKLSVTTVNDIYCILRKIFNKAVAWGFIAENPVINVKAPGRKQKERSCYSKTELIQVMEILKKEDYMTSALFFLVICTGMRREEIIGLHVDEDIDFNNNVINIRRAVVWDDKQKKLIEKETKTEGSVRRLPIPIFCADALKDYISFRERFITYLKSKNPNFEPVNNLFLNKNGYMISPDAISKKWRLFVAKNNELKRVTLHGLRHTYCSIQMNDNSNLSPPAVKKLMGHTQLSTTFLYAHAPEEKNDEAVSIFNELYEATGEKIVNFNQLLSIYTKHLFAPTSEINEILNFITKGEKNIDSMYDLIKNYIDNKYPFLSKIDITDLNINNVWDWLETEKKLYGNKFILNTITY